MYHHCCCDREVRSNSPAYCLLPNEIRAFAHTRYFLAIRCLGLPAARPANVRTRLGILHILVIMLFFCVLLTWSTYHPDRKSKEHLVFVDNRQNKTGLIWLLITREYFVFFVIDYADVIVSR